jgi:hypothetical protein
MPFHAFAAVSKECGDTLNLSLQPKVRESSFFSLDSKPDRCALFPSLATLSSIETRASASADILERKQSR